MFGTERYLPPALASEVEFAQLMWAVCLVNALEYHGLESEWGILEFNEYTPWDVQCVECTPRIGYWVNYFVDPVLQVPVPVEKTTFGSVKYIFR